MSVITDKLDAEGVYNMKPTNGAFVYCVCGNSEPYQNANVNCKKCKKLLTEKLSIEIAGDYKVLGGGLEIGNSKYIPLKLKYF